MCVCQRSIEYTLLMIVCPLVFYIEDELGATCCFISLTQHEINNEWRILYKIQTMAVKSDCYFIHYKNLSILSLAFPICI